LTGLFFAHARAHTYLLFKPAPASTPYFGICPFAIDWLFSYKLSLTMLAGPTLPRFARSSGMFLPVRKSLSACFLILACFLVSPGIPYAQGQPASQKKTSANQALLAAIEANDLPSVIHSLTLGASPNAVDDDSDNALMYAALYASPECMKLLLEKGASADQKNKNEMTALIWAAADLQKMQALVGHGADVNITPNDGNTPLMVAARSGRDAYPRIKYLLDNGANPRVVNKEGENLLDRAAAFGDAAILGLLLNQGIEITHLRGDKSPLQSAAFHENIPGGLWILDHMPDSPASDTVIFHALEFAVDIDSLTLITAMIRRCKNINWQDADGFTSLMWACYDEHNNIEVVKALLQAGANPTLKAKDGTTALDWARRKGNTPITSLLREYSKNSR
jgi:ankyrin repeat protein